MLLIPNGTGLLSSFQLAGPWHRTKSRSHSDDAKSQNSPLPEPREEAADRDTSTFLQSLRISETDTYRQTGRDNITLKLKHMAIYFSDSSHRLPPLPPLFGGGAS